MTKFITKVSKKQDGNITNITIPIGAKYLSEVIDKLPSNVLIHKGVTGCGGTTLEMTCDRCSIIVVPFMSLIMNKKEQHDKKGDVNLVPVCTGFKFDKVAAMEVGERMLNGENVKIMTTYDSFKKVYMMLRGFCDITNFFVLVDEWHILFNSSNFRRDAINSMYETTKNFKEVSYMTATPIKPEFIPEQLEGMDVWNLIWKDNARVNVTRKATNKPIHLTTKIVQEFIDGRRFGNGHFFLNSVRDIVRIVNTIGCSADMVKVVCAKNAKNKQTLGWIENESDLLVPKKVNFYTSTIFEGSDIFDKEGRIFVVSSGSSSALRTDISTSFTQIIGRIRDSMYADEVYHIVSTNAKGSLAADTVSYPEYLRLMKPRIALTKKLIDQYNSQPEEFRVSFGFEPKGKVTDFFMRDDVENVVKYDINKERFAASQHYIMTEIYSNGLKLNRELADAGYSVSEDKYEFITDSLKLESNKRVTFEELFSAYAELWKGNEETHPNRSERLNLIEEINPLVVEAMDYLGEDRVKQLEFGSTRIKRAIKAKKLQRFENNTAVVAMESIHSSFKTGRTYIEDEARKTLSGLYAALDIRKEDGGLYKGSVKHLERYFKIKKHWKTINGKKKRVIALK